MKLTKEKKAAAPAEAQVEKKPFLPGLSMTVWGLVVGAVLGLVVGLALSYVIYSAKVVQERDAQVREFSRQKATLSAKRIESHFQNISDRVAFFAGQTLLNNALVEGDAVTVGATKQSIARQLDNVVAVNVLKKEDVVLDNKTFPPINFSELGLIKTALRGTLTGPEATRVDGKWLLNVVAPVMQAPEGEVTGVVWVSLGIDAFDELLAQENMGLGQIQLFQNFGERSRVMVAELGSGDLEVNFVSKVGSSHWEIEFIASRDLYLLTHIDIGLVYALIAAAFLLCLAGFSGAGFVIGRMLNARVERKRMMEQMSTTSSAAQTDGFIDPLYQTKNLFDVAINKADENLLGMDDDDGDEASSDIEELSLDDDVFEMGDDEGLDMNAYPAEVFRAYDIRGVAKEQIDKGFAIALGKALGSEVIDQRENTMVVARDARTHSPELTEWLIRGILSTGCNVLNVGTVPTPLMYFTLETMEEVASGVMVTASHNDAEYNGFKVVMGGVSRSGEDIQELRKRMVLKNFSQGQGHEHHHDIVPSYIDTIFSDVALAGEMSLVIDAGNGVAGKVAPQLFEELGCRIIPLYCDLDGTFPNHSPDPSKEENLQDLIAKVKEEEADLGIALDGDGDRLTVVTPSGKIIWADRLLMLFAKDIISRNPGADVIFDVKSTRHLNACVASFGGRPIMWKTGHSLMKQKMMETGALVGAEYSGHIFIKDRWFGFDDGMYAAARLLEVLSLQGDDIDVAFDEFPDSIATPEIRIPVAEKDKFEIIDKLKEEGDFGEGRLTLLDGVRADFSYGWGLTRASNTGAEITLRFEADDEASMHKLKALFVGELRKIDSGIQVDWTQ